MISEVVRHVVSEALQQALFAGHDRLPAPLADDQAPDQATNQAHNVFAIALRSDNAAVQSALASLLVTTRLAHGALLDQELQRCQAAADVARRSRITRQAAHRMLDRVLSQPDYQTMAALLNLLDVYEASVQRRHRGRSTIAVQFFPVPDDTPIGARLDGSTMPEPDAN